MSKDGLTILFVSLGVGVPVFVGGLLFFLFSVIKRTIARQRAALEHEGIVMDSGPVWLTIRFANFRAANLARGIGIEKKKAALVLSRSRFVLVPSRWAFESVPVHELHRFTAGVAEDGALHLHTDDPWSASGSLDYRVPVGDAGEWVRALTTAGARHHHG